VLIIGLGSIGGETAKKFHYGFGCKVTGVKRNIKNVPKELSFLENVITE